MFNKYFQDELAYLRDLGKEFAAAYPGIAPMLAERGGDPDVERLLEGTAFLSGKIRQKIDDELPEIIHSVAALLFPHYVRQVPSTSIVEFSPLPNVVREKLVVPRGAEVGSVPVDGVSCRFRTTQEVELLPITVDDVRVDTGQTLAQTLRLELKMTGGANFASLNLRSIRFYIQGDRRTQDDVRLWLGEHVESFALASVDSSGKDNVLTVPSRRSLELAGFAEEQALIPYPDTVYPGFRLLQEYFTLPQKFAFFEVGGFERLPADKVGERFSILIQFKDSLPPNTRLTKDSFKLFCSPVVNLFVHPADPIKPDPTKHEYLIRPSGGDPNGYEIYSIDNVVGIARKTSQRVKIPSFLSFEHEIDPEAAERGVFYQHHLRPAAVGDGADVYLSFGTPADVKNLRLRRHLDRRDVHQPSAPLPAQAR
jgi:type VI secretion system protein ImpG